MTYSGISRRPLLPLLLPRRRGLLVQKLLQPLRARSVGLAQRFVLLLRLRPIAELKGGSAEIESCLRVVRVEVYRLPRRVPRALPVLRPHARNGKVTVRRRVVGAGLDRLRQHL